MIGIYIEVYEQLVRTGAYLFTIRKFNSYSHNIAAVGGFWDATLDVPVTNAQAENWYEQGLGRQILVKNHFGGTVWKGFVNKITLTVGSQTLTRGPLLDIVNRAGATYTPRQFPPDGPPVDGTTTVTPLVDDEISKERYGILEKWTAAGATADATAEQVRDVYLAQNKYPKTTGDFSITGTGSPISMSLELQGNIHWLTVYTYNYFTPGLTTAYAKLIAVLNANVNTGFFSTDYNYIEDNAFAMDGMEDKNRYAWDVINEIISMGNDTDDQRRLFGMYEEDKIHYKLIPSTVDYEYTLAGQYQRIVNYHNGVTIYPWDVRPGKWIYVPDLMAGRIVDTTDLLGDMRNKFIENVNFSSPFTVGITGSPFDSLTQMLAKITYLGGAY